MKASARVVCPGITGVEYDARRHGNAHVLAEKRFGDAHDPVVGQVGGDRLVVCDDPSNAMAAIRQVLGPFVRRGDQTVADLHHFVRGYYAVHNAPALDPDPLDEIFDG